MRESTLRKYGLGVRAYEPKAESGLDLDLVRELRTRRIHDKAKELLFRSEDPMEESVSMGKIKVEKRSIKEKSSLGELLAPDFEEFELVIRSEGRIVFASKENNGVYEITRAPNRGIRWISKFEEGFKVAVSARMELLVRG